MPLIGANRDYLSAGMRVIFHGAYAIYYLPSEVDVTVLRVLHGARDVVSIADEGGFEV